MAQKREDVFELLVHLGSDQKKAVYLRPGCAEDAIERLQRDAQGNLGETIPDSYIRLLRLTNGIQINGAYFKKAENLVAENLDVPYDEAIVLGDEGSLAEYVFDKRDRQFHTINLGFPDERFESYATFEEMLWGVLREQQVID